MKILLLGSDGYIGRPLSLHLAKRGHEVFGLDNFSRRARSPHSLIELPDVGTSDYCDIVDSDFFLLNDSFDATEGYDVIIHLAEQPSGPWSMKSKKQAMDTQAENVLGNLNLLWQMKEHCPDAHLIKIGSMGEYGTPDCDIPEGFIPDYCSEYERHFKQAIAFPSCPMKGMAFPKQPGSFYHLSKVFDTMNIEFACRMWGLRSTDIMQGVVFGLNYWDTKKNKTRFDYDECFGTVINRFCAQAISGHPLTVYGSGGQTRGYLPLKDSIECLTLALDNPPENGEYRVFNQYAKIFSVMELAQIVKKVGDSIGLKVEIENIENPRIELESHRYDTTNENLRSLGYNPTWKMESEIKLLLEYLKPYAEFVRQDLIKPTIQWK
jgi:UDP-sulfoquinovose synthase